MRRRLEALVAKRTSQYATRIRALESLDRWVVHELSAPVRRLSGFTRLLRSECNSTIGPAGSALLDRIEGQAERLADMIEGLTRLASLQTLRPERREIASLTLVHEVWTEIDDFVGEFQGTFTVEAIANAYGDPRLVRLIWINLLANARKYARASHRIEITAGSRITASGEPVFYVADNGVGFSADEAERVFLPFVRLSSGTSQTGQGIGLSLVRAIAELHAGRAWCESGEGRGTCFFFTLGRSRSAGAGDPR